MSRRQDGSARPHVALVLLMVGDLSGSGGAERQFADLFDHLRTRADVAATLITSASSLRHLRDAGKVRGDEGVIVLPVPAQLGRSVFNVVWMTLTLLFVSLTRGFDVVHLCLPTPIYVPFAALLTALPASIRPRLVLMVIDCTLAWNWERSNIPDTYERQVVEAHRRFFAWSRIDAIYSWYEAVVTLCQRHRLLPRHALIAAARYCFTQTDHFAPAAKQKVIVYAGRLSAQKRPLLFVDAVAELRARYPELVGGWRFEIYGRGVLAAEVAARITERRLGDIMSLDSALDMAPIFARTRLFVSTQAFENFTSLAMLEAMAAGNAVIAEDVGQTHEFVRDSENGLVVTPPTPEAFAEGMARYLREPDRHAAMAIASRRLATEVHTIEHFTDDILAFWRRVAAGPGG